MRDFIVPCEECCALVAEHFSGRGRPMIVTPDAGLAAVSAARIVAADRSRPADVRVQAFEFLADPAPQDETPLMLAVGLEAICAACSARMAAAWDSSHGVVLTPHGLLVIGHLVDELLTEPSPGCGQWLLDLSDALTAAMEASIAGYDERKGGS